VAQSEFFLGITEKSVAKAFPECPLSGVKQTSPFALHMSAFDPKRTIIFGKDSSAVVTLLSLVAIMVRSQRTGKRQDARLLVNLIGWH